MSLATRCTACGTVFRVVQDQLKVSEGWVRCGRCDEVFNALEGLFDLERDSPPEWAEPSRRRRQRTACDRRGPDRIGGSRSGRPHRRADLRHAAPHRLRGADRTGQRRPQGAGLRRRAIRHRCAGRCDRTGDARSVDAGPRQQCARRRGHAGVRAQRRAGSALAIVERAQGAAAAGGIARVAARRAGGEPLPRQHGCTPARDRGCLAGLVQVVGLHASNRRGASRTSWWKAPPWRRLRQPTHSA